MGAVVIAETAAPETLPALVDRAAAALANSRTSAEVLEARDIAGAVYDLAKRTARLMRAKRAHDELVAAAYRAQGDALLIESQAKIRLADEYDAAQERGDVQGHGGQGKRDIPDENIPSVTDIGLTPKQVYEAREFRDAEREDPGVVRRTVDAKVAAGEEPTKAAVREVIRPPKQSPAITGDSAVYHAIYETRQRIEPLGDARDAIRRFPPQLRHAVSAENLEWLAAWFSDAADEWRNKEAFNVAAE
jgi:hypothetical protein